MAAEPLPREPISGTCDASGNLMLKYRAPTQFYAHCYVAIQVGSGTPTYAVTTGGLPLIFGQGTQTQLGPILLQPGETASIIVTGAAALAAVAGHVLGWQAQNPEDLVPLLPLQPTAVLLATTSTTTTTAAGSFMAGATTSRALPRGTFAARVSFPADGSTNWPSITGGITGRSYFPDATGFFTVDWTDTVLFANPGMAHGDLALVVYGGVQATQIVGGPQLWQAPNMPPTGFNAAAIAASTDVPILAGSPGLIIYLFRAWLVLNVSAVFQLWNGPSASGTLIWQSPSGVGPFPLDFAASKLSPGVSLVARSSVLVALNGNISWSQG